MICDSESNRWNVSLLWISKNKSECYDRNNRNRNPNNFRISKKKRKKSFWHGVYWKYLTNHSRNSPNSMKFHVWITHNFVFSRHFNEISWILSWTARIISKPILPTSRRSKASRFTTDAIIFAIIWLIKIGSLHPFNHFNGTERFNAPFNVQFQVKTCLVYGKHVQFSYFHVWW